MEINLPDGSVKELEKGSNGLDLAKSIGAGLAKSAVAIVVNGEQRDLLDELPDKSSVSIITIQSDEGLEIMRHTLTAQVLQKLSRIYIQILDWLLGLQLKTAFTMTFPLKHLYRLKIFQK